MTQIIPAILATTEADYKDKLAQIEGNEALKEGWVQIDLMDNKFVQNQSIATEVIKNNPTSFNLEAHLMVEYPLNWIDDLIESGVKRIIFPVEDSEGVKERVTQIKNAGLEVGLSINPETAVESVADFVADLDLVLVMSVNPGFAGQEFIPATLERVKDIKAKGWDVKIEVDGGIDLENAPKLVAAGADVLVIGSHLLEGDIDENLEEIWEAINTNQAS